MGYVRLHGRNYRNWFSLKANVRERYDHLYSADELEPWVARVKTIAEDTEDTYAVTNNHNLGKSTVNALQLKAFLSGSAVDIRPELRESYPELKQVARENTAVDRHVDTRAGQASSPASVRFGDFSLMRIASGLPTS